MLSRAFWSVAVVCACVPGVARAQPPASGGLPNGDGIPYGPRVVPLGTYAGDPDAVIAGPLPGPYNPGRFTFGFYLFYSGNRGWWSNGLSLYGPPVPVPGPIPGVFGNDDLVRRWEASPVPSLPGYPWLNTPGYGGSSGLSLSTARRSRLPSGPPHAVIERLPPGPTMPVAPVDKSGGGVVLSLRLPQPAAQVYIDGLLTIQTGTDRIFETPPLEAGKSHAFTVTARWIEGGQVIEMTKTATGTPGEVVRVDFGMAPIMIRR
jgi:uncharacterized protein (TIGR03000 family)